MSSITERTPEQLYREYYPSVFNYVLSKTGRREEAEDLTQETFLKALRAFSSLRTENPRPWLFTIATHVLIDAARKKEHTLCSSLDARLEEGYDPPSGERDDPSRFPDQEAIGETLRLLPEFYRVPMILFAYHGYSMKDIAHRLGCSQDAVKARLSRARKMFRQHYCQRST